MMKHNYSILYSIQPNITLPAFQVKTFMINIYNIKFCLNLIYNHNQVYLLNEMQTTLLPLKLNKAYNVNGLNILIKEIDLNNNVLKIGIIM